MRRALLLLPLASLAPSIARADEPPPKAPPPTTVPETDGATGSKKDPEVTEVRVIGERADSLQRLPGSGTVIKNEEIKRAAPVEASEMLRRVPGVQVRQDYGAGGRMDVSIRGLDAGRSRRVLLLEDGVPISINPYSEPDLYHTPAIERYRAVEIVKGSGNILFGPQTLAGTINFITLAPPERRTLVFDYDNGTYGYGRAVGIYGDRVGETAWVVQIVHRRGDGFRGLPFESTSGLAKVRFETNDGGTATLKLGFHRDDAGADDVGLTQGMYARDPRRPTISPNSALVLNRYDASLIHEQRLGDRSKLKTLVYGYRTDRLWRRQEYTRSGAPGEAYERIVGDTAVRDGAIYFKNTAAILDREYDVLGVEPRIEHRADTGPVSHTFDLGGRLLRETAHYQTRQASSPRSDAGSLDFEERHTGTAVAAYLQDRIAFRPDLLVTPGVRVEHLAFERRITRQDTGNGPADTDVRGERSVTGFIPGVGMIYGSKKNHVFGGMHLGFAPPRVTSAINPRGLPTETKADESMSYEIGTRTTPLAWTHLEVTGFLSNFNNQVIVNTQPGADSNLIDAGATRIFGAESAARAEIGRALRLPLTVDLGARYTYSRASFRYGATAGNLLPYAPLHSFNTNVDVEHATGLGGQVAYAYVSEQFTDAINTVSPDVTGRVGELDARHLVDATIHYRHKASGISLRLTGKNLLDQTYVIARRPEGIFTGPYRQILVGLRWEYEAKPDSGNLARR